MKMAVEMINSIRAAEEAAAEIRKAGLENAKSIINNAEVTAKSNSEASEKNAYDEANRVLAEADNRIKELAEEQNKAFAELSSKTREAAEVKIDSAADFILKELLKI